MRWADHVVCMGARRGAYRALAGRYEGRSPIAISRHRWKNNIEMDLQYVKWRGMDWIPLTQDRDRWQAVVKVMINLRFP